MSVTFVLVFSLISVAGAVGGFFLGCKYKRDSFFEGAKNVVYKQPEGSEEILGISIYYSRELFEKENKIFLNAEEFITIEINSLK